MPRKKVVLNDQREAQRMLKQALTFLNNFYDKKTGGTGFSQEPVGPPPPTGFKDYKSFIFFLFFRLDQVCFFPSPFFYIVCCLLHTFLHCLLKIKKVGGRGVDTWELSFGEGS